MKDKSQIEDKAVKPASNKLVKVRFKQGRALEGVGKPGDVVEVSEETAQRLVKMKYVEIVKETQ